MFNFLGGASLATCPHLTVGTLVGSGGTLLGGPFVPFGGLVVGAIFGGLAGGSAGGFVHCSRTEEKEAERAVEYFIRNHPEG